MMDLPKAEHAFALLIVGTGSLVMAVYRHWRRRHAALLVSHYGGHVSPMGDSVQFPYRETNFEVRRVASGGGLGGTASYAQLVMFLAQGKPLVLAPAGAAKYVYATAVPSEHSVLKTPSTKMLIVGPDHKAVTSALDIANSSDLIDRLFARPFATMRIRRNIGLSSRQCPDRQWTLQLNGIPEEIYERPKALQPILDDLIDLSTSMGLLRTHQTVEQV
jgi:hypothetical protein